MQEPRDKTPFLRRKPGFAIVLVAALAGLVFLLGASLVALSQLQGAAANYDQRMRLAREHARASLEIALAELQKHVGRDQVVTYAADAYRQNTAEDFKSPAAATSATVNQPFWMAAYPSDGGKEPVWLVTRPISSDFDTSSSGIVANPRAAEYADSVTLVGGNTAVPALPGEQAILDVRAPRESIQIDGLEGYTDQRTIGHYAYWVGDLGVKTSYAVYDRTEEVTHGAYADDDRRTRLRQMRAAKAALAAVDTNLEDPGAAPSLANSNPMRVRSFLNDFQFRERYGNDDAKERFLLGLSDAETRGYFHDFTPLSRGLLTDTERGGLRFDLSSLLATGDAAFDANYLYYSDLAESARSTSSSYGKDVFPIAPVENGPAVAPVLMQFNLNVSLFLRRTSSESELGDLYLSYNASCSLWNPYTSRLAAEPLTMVISGLPHLQVWLGENAPFWQGALGESMTPAFELETVVSASGESVWRPGQVLAFSGPEGVIVAAGGETWFSLGIGSERAGSVEHRVETKLTAGDVLIGTTAPALNYGFQEVAGGAEIVVHLYRGTGASEELLASYRIGDADGRFVADALSNPEPFAEHVPSFGFGWKIDEAAFPFGAAYGPTDPDLTIAALSDFENAADALVNRTPPYESGEYSLFGYNPVDAGEDAVFVDPIHYDFPFLQLPKQELMTVSHLAEAFGASYQASGLGDPSSPENRFFDQYFFSSFPNAESGWGIGEPLANAPYEVVGNGIFESLAPGSAAESLWVHGMLNVHSTSIDSWAALLKASPASKIPYWISVFEPLEADAEGENSVLDEELYLFFNMPQSGEDVFHRLGVLAGDDFRRKARAARREGVFTLTTSQVESLAGFIVSNIRKRIQGVGVYSSGNRGPFISLRDFVDSGVLENAVKELEAAGIFSTRPEWLVESEPDGLENAIFRQSTVLNAIGPYLSARSDTFLVRAYGDAVNPADPTELWARAYCEAIVQRVHAKHASDADPTDPTSATSLGSADFGRQLKVVAFRWLSPSEI